MKKRIITSLIGVLVILPCFIFMHKILVLILFVMAIVGASHYIHGTSIPQFSDEMMEMICIEEGI